RSMRIPTIYDAQKYGYLEMMVAGQSSDWKYVKEKMPSDDRWMPTKYLEKYGDIDKMLEKSNTTAFVVIKNGQVYYEKYFNGIEQGDLTQIFSITKTITTAALGLALQD